MRLYSIEREFNDEGRKTYSLKSAQRTGFEKALYIHYREHSKARVLCEIEGLKRAFNLFSAIS